MKVGILTFHFVYNYGAVLQAWGLQQAIESLGHEVCFVNYVPSYMKNRISPFCGWGFRSGSKFFTTFHHRLRESRRRNRFSVFPRKHLKVSKFLNTREAMQEFCENLDAVIVGSDQVWNLNWLNQFDDTYFLGFLKGDKPKKIAYGACFGQIKQPKKHLDKACELIKHFDHIGMRNQFGHEILNKSVGIETEAVVDPGFFIRVSKDKTLRNEISVYAVDKKGAEICAKTAKKVANFKDAKTLYIASENNIQYPKNGKHITNLTPIEWLNQLACSTFICSESFHGTVFALANSVPFISASGGYRSTRVEDLLIKYGLKDRYLNSLSDFKYDFCELDSSYYLDLQRDIDHSINFLEKALL